MQQDPTRDILPALPPDRRREAETLLTHARNANFTVENGVVYYINRAHRNPRPIGLTGITRPLHDLYWPAYTPYARRTASAKPKSSRKRPRPQWATYMPPETPPRHLLNAQELAHANVRGSIVHRQIGEYVRYDKQHFALRNPSGAHPLTQVAIAGLLRNGYLPLAFDFPVACEAAYVGTPMDLWAVHEQTGRLAFFELKTSQSRTLFMQDDPDVPFTGILATLAPDEPRSACTRAKVQLGLELVMLFQGHGFEPARYDAFVLLLSEEDGDATAEFIDVGADFLLNVIAPLYLDFVGEVPRWRTARKEERQRKRGSGGGGGGKMKKQILY